MASGQCDQNGTVETKNQVTTQRHHLLKISKMK